MRLLLDKILAAALRLAGPAAALLPQRGPTRQQEQQRIRRLAGEIIEVARSIEADARRMAPTPELEYLDGHARQCRVRAQQATSRWNAPRGLDQAAEQIHQDHWRVVTLRSELDGIMSGRRRERGSNTRSCRYATGSRPVRSRWSTLSHPTRPTGLD